MVQTPPELEGTQGRGGGGWGSAALRAALMLVVSILGFVFIPNQLLTYLSLRVVPRERDLLVTLWWVVTLVACSWLFVRLQQGRRR
ncbi:MAG: hypothetical protein HY240_06555 [Actinobacteria bacterium]|nr:hypothetical protein [Actinomycetota bacterium]